MSLVQLLLLISIQRSQRLTKRTDITSKSQFDTVLDIEGGYYLVVFVFLFLFLFFSLVLLSFVLSCPWSLCSKWQDHDSYCFCFFVFFFFSLSLVPLTRSYWCCCVCYVKLFQKSVPDHYSVGFLGKWRMFKLESLFRVSTLLYTSSLDF